MTLFSIFIAMLLAFPAGLQDNQVKAKHSIETVSDDTVRLTFDLTIAQGWHVYSTNIADGGPTQASILFDSINGARPAGGLYFSGNEITAHDPTFNMEVRYFEKRVRFIQDMIVTDPAYHIEGSLNYGACNDISCLPPQNVNFTHNGKANPITEVNKADGIESVDGYNAATWAPVTYSDNADGLKGRGLLGLFITGFLGGLLALLTPCVWPIIPMTVSFFLKRSQKRGRAVKEAVLYGISIIAVYVALGLAITLIFGASALNSLATNAIVNILFFLILVAFALSFFGLFEITLPSRWSTGTDSKAGAAGFGGIFFMALTLTIVSFSCTGPIIGFLLVDAAQTGSILAPTVGMLGFSTAMAIPFALFAMFPGWLGSMPKSGGWMDKVKVTLAFIELAFSLKFLSVADMAYGWGILPRDLFVLLWIVMAVMLGLYLIGVLRFRKGIKRTKPGPVSIAVAAVSFLFALWMVPGLWGAPLKAVSAFTPPMNTQIFRLRKDSVEPKYTDYALALEESARTGKPVLIDFTGYGCVNCRKMEAAVWTDPRVSDRINNDYILVSLYVDDKTPLPSSVKINENGTEVRIRTIGDKWSLLQRHKFGANAQPFYVIVQSDGSLAGGPYSFDPDVESFLKFLN